MEGLTVIIPCYNEEGNLKNGVLDEVAEFLASWDVPTEVWIVDDESTDGSLQLIKSAVNRYPSMRIATIPHGGKPAAVHAGIESARHATILFTDMDQSTPITEVGKLWPHIEAGADVVIGSRGRDRAGASLLRKAAANTFRALRRTAILKEIDDTQCGFKMMRTALAAETFPRLSAISATADGWTVSAFDVELLHLCKKRGASVVEVPVTWSDRDLSTTKFESGRQFKFLAESIDMAKQVATIRLNDVLGKYD